MNRRAKFDAANFILGEEIRNRTNKQTNTHTHAHTQTVNDISTPPSADRNVRITTSRFISAILSLTL